jgi:hypothetical protein
MTGKTHKSVVLSIRIKAEFLGCIPPHMISQVLRESGFELPELFVSNLRTMYEVSKSLQFHSKDLYLKLHFVLLKIVQDGEGLHVLLARGWTLLN